MLSLTIFFVWQMFHLRFNPQFRNGPSAEEQKGRPIFPAADAKTAGSRGSTPRSTPAASPHKPGGSALRSLTAEDLAALDRYHQRMDAKESLPELYRNLFAPKPEPTGASSDTDEYALDTVHVATSEDFTSPDVDPSAPRSPVRATRNVLGAIRNHIDPVLESVLQAQRTRFLINCLRIDSTHPTERMMHCVEPVLAAARRSSVEPSPQSASKVTTPTTASQPKRGADTGQATVRIAPAKTVTVEPPRYFTQEMVTAILAFRSQRGSITSVSTCHGVVSH